MSVSKCLAHDDPCVAYLGTGGGVNVYTICCSRIEKSEIELARRFSRLSGVPLVHLLYGRCVWVDTDIYNMNALHQLRTAIRRN